jgi:hypothetical protein
VQQYFLVKMLKLAGEGSLQFSKQLFEKNKSYNTLYIFQNHIFTMGNKSSKSSISDEDLTFLMRNTNKSAEEIQVRTLSTVGHFTLFPSYLDKC